MTLKSALEDLLGTTLASISGTLGKLDYVATLRRSDGLYSHWGLSRTYGETAAQHAIAEAHTLLFLKVLRTPLHTLREDLTVASQARHLSATEYIDSLQDQASSLMGDDLRGGSRRHLNSVLHALSALAKPR